MTSQPSVCADDQGHPRLQSSIVDFLDLLGCSVSATAASDEDPEPLPDKLCDSISKLRNYLCAILTGSWTDYPAQRAVTSFSNDLVLDHLYQESRHDAAAAAWLMIRYAQRCQLRVSLNGLFLGGLTFGPMPHRRCVQRPTPQVHRAPGTRFAKV